MFILVPASQSSKSQQGRPVHLYPFLRINLHFLLILRFDRMPIPLAPHPFSSCCCCSPLGLLDPPVLLPGSANISLCSPMPYRSCIETSSSTPLCSSPLRIHAR